MNFISSSDSNTRGPAPLLPQSGWYLDEEWAKRLSIEVRTFRKNCRSVGIPMFPFGVHMIVKAEDFYQHLAAFNEE